MSTTKTNVIAIDGPSGSGKSTVAKEVSKKLKLTYLDTGAMFRALGFVLNEQNISASDTEKITSFLEKIKFDYAVSSTSLVVINDIDLTKKIREHHVSKLASIYSQAVPVRDYLKKLQRDIANKVPSILDGRDIGTVIFPHALLKVYLNADSKIRAERRLAELKIKDPNKEYNFEKILSDIEARDLADRSREIAPLKKAEDAIEIDSTSLSVSEIVDQIVTNYQSRLN